MNTKAAMAVRAVAFLLFQGVCLASIPLDTKCSEDHGIPNAGRSLLQLSPEKVNPEKVVDPKQVGALEIWSYTLPSIECEEDVGSPDNGLLADKRIHLEAPTSSVNESAKKCGRLCVDNNATIMYAIERLDGLGSTLGSLILFMATAFSNSVGFGGLLHHRLQRANESDFKTMSTLMGLEYLDLVTTTPPKFRTCLHGLSEYGNHLGSLSKIRGTLLLDVYAHTRIREFASDSVMTPDFLSRLRAQSGIWSVPAKHFKPETKYNVAVHLRRGDITPNSTRYPPVTWKARWAADSEYLSVVEHVEAVLPSADIHFFSVLEKPWTESDFDIFSSKAKHSVHLGGDDVSDWAHMAKADVLIMGPSSFSLVAALFNPKCVLNFKHFGKSKLSDWIEHDRGSFSMESIAQLQECVQKRVLQH